MTTISKTLKRRQSSSDDDVSEFLILKRQRRTPLTIPPLSTFAAPRPTANDDMSDNRAMLRLMSHIRTGLLSHLPATMPYELIQLILHYFGLPWRVLTLAVNGRLTCFEGHADGEAMLAWSIATSVTRTTSAVYIFLSFFLFFNSQTLIAPYGGCVDPDFVDLLVR